MSDSNALKSEDLPDFKKPDGATMPMVDGNPPAQPADSTVYRIPVQVMAVLGKAVLQVNDLMKLGRGAVIELDSKVGEPIEIYVNNRRVAKGELIVQGERLSVSMTEVLKIQDG